jgi:hypothetical protein
VSTAHALANVGLAAGMGAGLKEDTGSSPWPVFGKPVLFGLELAVHNICAITVVWEWIFATP